MPHPGFWGPAISVHQQPGSWETGQCPQLAAILGIQSPLEEVAPGLAESLHCLLLCSTPFHQISPLSVISSLTSHRLVSLPAVPVQGSSVWTLRPPQSPFYPSPPGSPLFAGFVCACWSLSACLVCSIPPADDASRSLCSPGAVGQLSFSPSSTAVCFPLLRPLHSHPPMRSFLPHDSSYHLALTSPPPQICSHSLSPSPDVISYHISSCLLTATRTSDTHV